MASAFTLMQKNRAFIQEQTVAYIANVYPSFSYNVEICSRDVGLIVDCISNDVYWGSHDRAIAAGKSYFNGTASVFEYQKSAQKTFTINTLNWVLSNLVEPIVSNSAAITSYVTSETQTFVALDGSASIPTLDNNWAIITGTIQNGANVQPYNLSLIHISEPTRPY